MYASPLRRSLETNWLSVNLEGGDTDATEPIIKTLNGYTASMVAAKPVQDNWAVFK